MPYRLGRQRAVGKNQGGVWLIEKENFHIFNYIKKEEYTASMDGMRYMLKKKDGNGGTVLEVIIWPEPCCFAKTPEEKKSRKEFAFSPEGVMEAADWLNGQYRDQKEMWEQAKRRAAADG
ncbi:hypothetical protein IMSAGC019_01115 [Lachnospiraceae bacterium]|nr:hypothetical protein IMSAGC019_01115 [Lachnospiraceae bacterium]